MGAAFTGASVEEAGQRIVGKSGGLRSGADGEHRAQDGDEFLNGQSPWFLLSQHVGCRGETGGPQAYSTKKHLFADI